MLHWQYLDTVLAMNLITIIHVITVSYFLCLAKSLPSTVLPLSHVVFSTVPLNNASTQCQGRPLSRLSDTSYHFDSELLLITLSILFQLLL